MSLRCGIFGLPNVGKSTCLNALSQVVIAEASNYPFCTINPNHSIVSVPDPRLSELSQIVNAKQVIPATVEFVDIAGLVKNAAQGEGLGNQFLSHVRSVDALVHVVRCFEDPEIIHVANTVEPLSDIEIINTELILADLAWLEKIRHNIQKRLKANEKTAREELELLLKVEQALNHGQLLRQLEWDLPLLTQLKKWEFLTIKPLLYLANTSENATDNKALIEQVKAQASQEKTEVIVSCIKLESDLIGVSDTERAELLDLLEGEAMGLGELIRKAYQLLGLQTFFTAGVKEVRAWTMKQGETAWDAAGCIHSDFQRGFIVAEVVSYQDFIHYQGVKGAKLAGKWRTERKSYIVQDGDVILFQFNV